MFLTRVHGMTNNLLFSEIKLEAKICCSKMKNIYFFDLFFLDKQEESSDDETEEGEVEDDNPSDVEVSTKEEKILA